MGCGDPNKRTFEIFASGSLWMSNITDLDWGFKDGDAFHDLCIFTTAEEFIRKKNLLLTNEPIYREAIELQTMLLKKYFAPEPLRNYILEKSNII